MNIGRFVRTTRAVGTRLIQNAASENKPQQEGNLSFFDQDDRTPPPLTTNFDSTDLETLRDELMRSGLDLWQAGELVSSFLATRGYGVSAGDARTIATRIEGESCSLECMRKELGRLALVM